MTKEDKELLLKDLCARVPYNVKISVVFHNKREPLVGQTKKVIGTLNAIYVDEERVIVDDLSAAIAPQNVRCGGFLLDEDEVKPYLRPMSSMTEKEEEEFELFFSYGEHDWDNYTVQDEVPNIVDWYNAHHFDFRCLIPKGVALEAPKDMYKID